MAELYGIDASVLLYLAQQGRMVPLAGTIWSNLDNTHAHSISEGGWDTVSALSAQVGRNWLDIKQKIASGVPIDAPIVMKIADHYPLMAGTTRLIVARAAGIWREVYLHSVESPDEAVTRVTGLNNPR